MSAEAAEIVAGWAGISNGGRREIIAAMIFGLDWPSTREKAAQLVAGPIQSNFIKQVMLDSLRTADVLIRISKENPPT